VMLRKGLRELRERKGHWRSQGDVALQMGALLGTIVQPSLVSIWERRLAEPTERQATAYAAVIGVGLSEILDDSPDNYEARRAAVASDLAAMRHHLDEVGHWLAWRSPRWEPGCGR
jgi:transcriptional regulator with XRE-family HTH domain